MKKLTNFFNCAAKAASKTGGGSSQQRVSESETREVNHAIITQLSRNNHPITLRAIRYVAVLLMVFVVGIGNAWGATTLFSTNFSTTDGWSNENLTTSSQTETTKTIKGTTITFKGYKSASTKISGATTSGGTLTFTSNNLSASEGAITSSNPNYFMAIPVSGIVAGVVNVTFTASSDYTPYYAYRDGTGDISNRAQSSVKNSITITGLENTSATIYLGTSGKTMTSLTISTPDLTDLSASAFYSLYANSEKTYSQLIEAASFPSYITTNIATATNETGNSSTVATPHDFTGLGSGAYYRLKTANNNRIELEALSHVKSIRLYGNGNGSTRTVTVTATKISGTGTAPTITSMSMANSKKTVVEYTTGDLTALTGYNVNTYYTYTLAFPGAADIWGIYVEYAAPACTPVDAPTGLSCTAHTENSLTFGWTAATNASSYDVKLWTNSGCTGDPVASGNVTTTSKTFSGLDASTTYYCKVQSKGNGTTYCTEGGITSALEQATDASSCGATAPGNISKGAASGGTGTITLTAAGDIASGDTWYWQDAEDGTATDKGSGATKNVSATGTYYIRSYNATGTCWSSAKFVTVEAADLLTPITPSLSYSNSTLVLTALTSATPTLTGNAGGGTVTYALTDVTPAGCMEIVAETGVVTAVAAGTAKVTATIAANGNYAGGNAVSGIIKVVAAPVGMVDQKLATGDVAWDASVIVTEDYTNISGLTALSQHGSATASGNGNTSNGGQTSKIGTATGDFNDANYLELSFTVASGKEFEITSIAIPVQPVKSNTNNFKAVLSDNQGSTNIVGTKTNLANGTLANIDFSSYGTLKGTITLRIYAWGWGDSYRLGKNIVIDGTIKAEGACTTPTIAWDGDQPADAYVSDGSKTFKVTSNYTVGVALELSENTCGATIAAKSGSDNKQWVVSFTGAGSVKVTPKVVGDGSTVCATTVSAAAKTLTVTLAHDVTFNRNGHGAEIAKQVVADGGKATAPYVADVADWVFGGWYTDAECTEGNEFDFANTTISVATPLYAKWTADACASERKSLSKVVLTSASAGTVTGYNGDEYAGTAVIAGLSGEESADLGSGTVTGYKMNNGGSAIVFATLKKGAFQAGDKVVIGITKKNDAYKIDSKGQPVLRVYYGTDASDATLLTTIEGATAPGYYTYRLTEADVTTIGEKKGIGLFRESSNGQNPYVYSVEITGCRTFAVSHDVTFDMKGHGTAVAKQTLEVGAKVTEPAEPEAAGYIFGGWYKETTLENKWNFSTDVVPDNDITLYAKWTVDPCTDRQSLSKVVLTSESAGTVTGYNSNEYAGTELIAGLSSSKSADLGDGSVTGYKLNNGGSSMLMATLKKGNFQEGDKVTIGIVYQNDQRTVDDSKNIMTIYAGSDASHMMEVTTLTGVTGAGYYTYRLTAANAAAINEAGYKSIGLFRASSNGENHYVYSVEITGCREWAVSHDVAFNMMGHGAQVDPQTVPEGDLLTKPTVVEPEGWALAGWYKEEGLVNEWDFDIDVMGEENITLYAKWESEEGVIKLFSNTGVLNTTNFVSAAKDADGINIDEVNYPCLVSFGSNRSSLAGTAQTDVVQYNASTNAAKIKLDLYNNATGAKDAYLWMVEEGDESATPIVISVPGKTRLTTSYTSFNSEKPRSFYVTSGSKADIKVLQVKVLDNGTAIPQFGKAGYSVNLNKGRIIAAANGTIPFDGATMHSNEAYTVLNSSNFKPKTYIQFTNAVANTTVKITKASSNAYYVTNDLDNKGDSYNTDKEVVLTTTGTWYIGSVNSGSVAALSKIEFIAPKCEAPAFNALTNSDICEGDSYVALDGTGTVSDGGSITYKWYAQGSETVLATTATYTPSADGNYYVVALHHVDGYTDNEATSAVVTVTTHAAAAITTAPLNQRGAVGAEVMLSVAATGKNVAYKWYTCDEDGNNEVALSPEETGTSINVTIPSGAQWYKVKVTSDCGDAEAKAKVSEFQPATPANVTTTILWDWTSSAWPASGQVAFTDQVEDGTDLTPAYELLADADAIVPNNAAFRSDMLYGKGQWVWRSGNKFFQGTAIKFNSTVAGLVRVYYRSTGNNKHVKVEIKDVTHTTLAGTYETGEFRWSDYVEVAAGEVEILCTSTDANKSMTRIQKIEFIVPGYVDREVSGSTNISALETGANVTVHNGGTLLIDAAKVINDLNVENGGKVQLAANKLTVVGKFAIESTMAGGTSGQLTGATGENFEAAEAYIDITLGAGATSAQWHAFTVPFPVDAINGVYDVDGNKLTNEVNYAIMEYLGDVRAQGKYGWKKYRKTLVPGTFYIMTVDGERETYRFKKTAAGAIVAGDSKSVSQYAASGDGQPTDAGWNGIGNPTLKYGKVDAEVQVLDPVSYTFIKKDANSTNFVVGTPFFYQAEANGSISMLEANAGASYAPRRSPAKGVEKIKVAFGNEEFTDYLDISASEEATNDYQIGKDLAKMIMTSTPKVAQIYGKAYNTNLCMIHAPLTNDKAEFSATLYTPAAGEYSISAPATVDADVYLTKDGMILWNLSMSAYTLTLDKGFTTGYGLLLVKKAPEVATGIENGEVLNGANGVQKVIIDEHVYILREGQMYDVNGQMVK